MAWFAVYNTVSGDLVSVGSVVATPTPVGLAVLPLVDRPAKTFMWDKTTRTFVARPAKVLVDRVQDMLTNPAYADFQTIYNSLNAQRKTQIQNILGRLLGNSRFRNASETVEVG